MKYLMTLLKIEFCGGEYHSQPCLGHVKEVDKRPVENNSRAFLLESCGCLAKWRAIQTAGRIFLSSSVMNATHRTNVAGNIKSQALRRARSLAPAADFRIVIR
jgi:hypothetical protein